MISNLQSPQTGNPVANQFLISKGNSLTFQSYNKIIAKETNKSIYIDHNALEYSQTTLKYLKQFLNTNLSKKALQSKFKKGNIFKGKKIIIKNLNN